jgi:uncharacterized surface protein with fasciclin (FAS1) repeats
MTSKNGLLITTLFISIFSFCCNQQSNTARAEKDSLTMTAGTAVTGINNIVSSLSQSKEHSIFIKLLKESGLTETLNQPGPFTVFAPTNKAFEKSPAVERENWNNKDLLNFLSNHIVAGAVENEDLEKIKKLTTLSGGKLNVRSKNNKITINGMKISGASFTCTNGIIYFVDETFPPSK